MIPVIIRGTHFWWRLSRYQSLARSGGLRQSKVSIILSRIETATFRLVPSLRFFRKKHITPLRNQKKYFFFQLTNDLRYLKCSVSKLFRTWEWGRNSVLCTLECMYLKVKILDYQLRTTFNLQSFVVC